MDWLNALSGFIEAHATAPWALLLVLALAALDGLVPPLPAESVVITLAAYSAAGHGPNPLVLGVVAFVGGVIGDNLTYTLGRHSRLRNLRESRRPRLRKAFAFAERELGRRGGMLIFVARYIPVGRLAVNLTAGAIEMPRRTFVQYDTAACVAWAAWSVAVGYFFGSMVEGHPLLGTVLGIAFAAVIGWLVDRVMQKVTARG